MVPHLGLSLWNLDPRTHVLGVGTGPGGRSGKRSSGRIVCRVCTSEDHLQLRRQIQPLEHRAPPLHDHDHDHEENDTLMPFYLFVLFLLCLMTQRLMPNNYTRV